MRAEHITHEIKRRPPGVAKPWELVVYANGRLHSRTHYRSEGRAKGALQGITDDIIYGQKNDRPGSNR